MRVETARRKAGSKGYQSAVMPSWLVTALRATTWLCVLWSPCTPTDLHMQMWTGLALSSLTRNLNEAWQPDRVRQQAVQAKTVAIATRCPHELLECKANPPGHCCPSTLLPSGRPPDREEDCEGLPDLVVQAVIPYGLDVHLVHLTQHIQGVPLCHVPQDTHSQTRACSTRGGGIWLMEGLVRLGPSARLPGVDGFLLGSSRHSGWELVHQHDIAQDICTAAV